MEKICDVMGLSSKIKILQTFEKFGIFSKLQNFGGERGTTQTKSFLKNNFWCEFVTFSGRK